MSGARGALAAVVAATCMMHGATPAEAAFPGQNGKIAFRSGTEIRTVNPDGTVSTPVATSSSNSSVSWSPDGTRIAYVESSAIKVANADGTGQSTVYSGYGRDPVWSPDGSRIAFVLDRPWDEERSYPDQVTVIDVDGTDVRQVTTGTCAGDPGLFPPCDEIHSLSWSPNGTRIAFAYVSWYADPGEIDYHRNPGVGLANPDGPGTGGVPRSLDVQSVDWDPAGERLLLGGSTLATVLADGTGYYTYDFAGYDAEWSPDGAKILYQTAQNAGDVYVREWDGSNPVQVPTGGPVAEPTWQPVQPPIVRGYVRPKGATPLEARLVPAYRECGQYSGRNRWHGPPLEHPACAPPAQASGFLTVGTPDANGAPAKGSGLVRLDVVVGNPATPADEADVGLFMSITDVRAMNTLSDYTGEVGVRLPLRIVDRANTGPGPGVAVDMTFGFTVPCAATADTSVGSTCSAQTSMDAVAPGAAAERKRAIWQIGQVQVTDGGPDGDADTDANTLFMTQGVFVP